MDFKHCFIICYFIIIIFIIFKNVIGLGLLIYSITGLIFLTKILRNNKNKRYIIT